MSITNSFNRIRRETGIKRCMILEGNVGDVYLYDRKIRNLSSTLEEMFRESDFMEIVRWDRISGIKGDTEALKLTDDREEDQGDAYDFGEDAPEDTSNDGSCKSVSDILTVVNRTLSDENRKTLFILDWSEYMFSTGGQLDPEDRENLTLLGKAVRDLVPRYGSGDGRKSSAVIIITSKASMLPLSLYSGNPEASVIAITKPDMEERRQMLSKVSSGFVLAKSEGLLPVNERFEDYVDMLNDFTNREIIQMANMSHYEKDMTFEKLYYLFRYGEKENPWEKLDRDKVSNMKRFLSERVIGQEQAVDHVYRTIIKAFMGVTGMHKSSSRSMPKGVFFFVGPTGVGKTELSKALAKFLFGDESACIRFDMSEYAQPNSDQKLIGAPPGYVGYEEGGQLTNAIREKPFSVVLFDEIEKAAKPNPRILDIFLQILEDGRLTDNRGITTSFSDTVIIFTSNLGAAEVKNSRDREAVSKEFFRIVKEYFDSELKRPEILGRIGYENIIPFNFINDPAFARNILRSKLKPVQEGIREKYGIELAVEEEEEFLNHILKGADAAKGGRDILNALDSRLLTPLAQFLFDNYDDLDRLKGIRLLAFVNEDRTEFRADA